MACDYFVTSFLNVVHSRLMRLFEVGTAYYHLLIPWNVRIKAYRYIENHFFEVACDDFVTPFLNVVDLCHGLVRFARLTTNFGRDMQISSIVHKNGSNSTFSERKNFLQTNVSPAVCGFSAEILHTVLRFSHVV